MISQIVGLGEPLAREKMYQAIGASLFAHNGYVEVLQTQGFMGFIVYLIFLFMMYKFIKKNDSSELYPLSLAMFMMYVFEMLTQGGDYFLVYIFLGLTLSIVSNKNIYNVRKNA